MRNYYSLELVTPPATEPVTLQEAKDYLRITGSDEDALITSQIKVARQLVEDYTNRKLISQTWRVWLDRFPVRNSRDWWDGTKEMAISELISGSDFVIIPLAPLQSVTHFKTYDDAGTDYTFAASNYNVDNKGSFGRITLKSGSVWPSTVLRSNNAIEIQCVVGYATLPELLKLSVLDTLVHLYDCRGGGSLSSGTMSVLNGYRIHPI